MRLPLRTRERAKLLFLTSQARSTIGPAHRLARSPTFRSRRVSKLENLDEVEELNLVLEHYAVTWGNVGEDGRGIGLKGW